MQAGLLFSYTPVSSDDEIEMDEGFVDESMAVPSISEDVLTVGAGAPGKRKKKRQRQRQRMKMRYVQCMY